MFRFPYARVIARLSGLAALVALIGAPAAAQAQVLPGQAGPSACVWDHLPDDLRDGLLAVAAANGEPAALITGRQADLVQASRACGLESTIAGRPLWDFTQLRDRARTLASMNVQADDVERRFLAMDAGPLMTFTRAAVDLDQANDSEKELISVMVQVAGHEVGAPDSALSAISHYLLSLARVLDNDKHLWLAGKSHQGAVTCVYDRMPLVVRNAAYYQVAAGQTLDAWRTQYGDDVETASRACYLSGPLGTRALALRAQMYVVRNKASAGVSIDNIIFPLAALPPETSKRLRDLLNGKQPLSAEDDAWVATVVAGLLDAGHYTDAGDRDNATIFLTDTIRIDRLEGVS